MLDEQILSQISEYASKMTKPVFIRVSDEEHSDKQELMEMLEGVASTSDKIHITKESEGFRSGVSFGITSDENEKKPRIVFSGIPGGHEFNSFLLAILQAGGIPLKLDESLIELVKKVNAELHFETIVSLSCHNCPDVVQTLNQISLLNKNITHEMIDGGPFPEIIEERKIQGVPAIYLNGEPFANGKLEVSQIIERIIEQHPIPKDSIPQNTSAEVYDVTIIGGGPAGVSSAIYAIRKGLKVLLIADRVGGQVKDTMDIENMISITKTTGPNLVQSLEEHLGHYNVPIRKNLKVSSVVSGDIHKITLNTGEEISSKTIIVATGAKWRELGVPGEKENIGNGVAYCPHCDGPFFKGKDVIVVGGGNSGVEAALDLGNIVKSVTVLEYASDLKADKVLVDRANQANNIQFKTNVNTKSIETTNGKVSHLVYEDRKTSEKGEVKADGIFIQIGLIPNSSFVKGVVNMNQYGEIEVDSSCKTSVPGIFACGDVTNTPYKQIIIAMGEGAKASLSAFEYLMLK